MSEIWRQCKGERHIRPLQGRLVRLVESQEQVATLQLVDTLEEQALLEELLESSKPPVPADAEPLHYLLKTPFRYPPLRWGSRFGRRHEPSLFYAALKLETAMAESAYYRRAWFMCWNTSMRSAARSDTRRACTGAYACHGKGWQPEATSLAEWRLRCRYAGIRHHRKRGAEGERDLATVQG